MQDFSPTKQKILSLLLAGAALSLARTPQRQVRIVKGLIRDWKFIDRKKLGLAISALYRSKLVAAKEHPNGSVTLILTDKGKMKALTYDFKNIKLKRKNWDGNWRFVIFDIPEKLRVGRDALRDKLREMGFHELQKSVLVFPYECENEIEFIVEFFGMRRYVRYGIVSKIDNDLHLRTIFRVK